MTRDPQTWFNQDMSNHNETQCNACGTIVAILNGCPMNLSRQYDNGARYYRGAHHLTCDGGRARAANAAADAAHTQSQRRAAGAQRYMRAYINAGHTPLECVNRQLEVIEYVYG